MGAMLYKMGSCEIEIIESITVKNIHDEFSGTYEAKGFWNEVKKKIYEINKNTTKWVYENEFKCSGFMKIIAWLMLGNFKKETNKHLIRFKEFAEGQS